MVSFSSGNTRPLPRPCSGFTAQLLLRLSAVQVVARHLDPSHALGALSSREQIAANYSFLVFLADFF